MKKIELVLQNLNEGHEDATPVMVIKFTYEGETHMWPLHWASDGKTRVLFKLEQYEEN